MVFLELTMKDGGHQVAWVEGHLRVVWQQAVCLEGQILEHSLPPLAQSLVE
jgi:hypothetical protein